MAISIKRRRNPEDTRSRILSAAKVRFSIDNYDQVGVRDIAADAGVDPALVNRYFGSKEKLFSEVIAGAFCMEKHLPGKLDISKLGAHLAKDLMSDTDCCEWQDGCDPLQLLLRSAASPTASSLVSATFHDEFVKPLAKLIGGRDASLRAAMICAYAVGFGTMRVALKSTAIKARDTGKAATMLGEAFQRCIDVGKA